MARIECGVCKRKTSDHSKHCVHCGALQISAWRAVIVNGALMVVGFGLIIAVLRNLP